VSGYFGIPCYDLGRRSNITPRIRQNNAWYYYTDAVHPNSEGSKILSRIIERETKKVLQEWGK
jgi:lysophospholipase L1-like esterase